MNPIFYLSRGVIGITPLTLPLFPILTEGSKSKLTGQPLSLPPSIQDSINKFNEYPVVPFLDIRQTRVLS